MGALNIPSAADLERLTRRVRSVSQRLEGIEDGVDRLDERLAALAKPGAVEERLRRSRSSSTRSPRSWARSEGSGQEPRLARPGAPEVGAAPRGPGHGYGGAGPRRR